MCTDITNNPQIFPLWKELTTDISVEVLFRLSPSKTDTCRQVCNQWDQFLKNDYVWQQLSRYHFPSIDPKAMGSFRGYLNFHFNLPKGVCSVTTLEEPGQDIKGSAHRLATAGGKLFSGFKNGSIEIWDLDKHSLSSHFQAHAGWISSLAATKDGQLLFSASADKTLKVWNLANNTCLAVLEHPAPVMSLSSGEDGTLFSSCGDRIIRAWNWKTNTCQTIPTEHKGNIYSVAIHNKKLYSSAEDPIIRIWDLEKNVSIGTLEGHTETVSSLALAKDGQFLFSGSDDRTVKVWNLQTRACIATLKQKSPVFSLALLDAKLFVGCHDWEIWTWDWQTSTHLTTLKGHTGTVYSLAVTEDGKLISSSKDTTIKVWDFLSSHKSIFTEIANALKNCNIPFPNFNIEIFWKAEASFAEGRFFNMPKAAKSKIFGELYKIIKPQLKHDYWRCAEDAFYERYGQHATDAQKELAIRNYTQQLPE
jgi:hypothetical protein